MPTLFEKIIAGELPSTMVYRDSRVVAFLGVTLVARLRARRAVRRRGYTDWLRDESSRSG